MSDEMPKEIWLNKSIITDEYLNDIVEVGDIKYTRSDQTAEMQAAIVELRERTIELSANVQVLTNIINEPDGGTALQKLFLLRVAKDTVDEADQAIANTEKWV